MSIQSDYIMRMIEQFTRAIASIISSRKANNPQEAVTQICRASQRFLKTDIENLLKLNADQLLEHFTKKNTIDFEHAIFCADLIYEMALLGKDFPKTVIHLKTSCLNLYLVTIPSDSYFQTPDYFSKVSDLLKDLDQKEFSDSMKNHLEIYHKFLNKKGLKSNS